MDLIAVISDLMNKIASPLVHVPVLFLIAWFLKSKFGKHKTGISLIALGSAWLLFCSMTYTSVLLVHKLEHTYPVIKLDSEQWKKADVIVVLACYFYDDYDLPWVSRWPDCSLKRNLHASLMFAESAKPIYLSGGNIPRTNTTYAHENMLFMRKMGVPKEFLHESLEGFNSETEVQALAKKLQGKTVALVTSATHMSRAVNYFTVAKIKTVPIPVEHLSRKNIELELSMPNASNLYRSERAIHEFLGLSYQYIFDKKPD